ncbi:MAG: MarR family transcriptional regulator [Myxococcota bacterium]
MDEKDLIDELVREWNVECPELDPSAMGVVGRIMRLGRRFERDATLALKPLGLPYTDFDIIATLRRSGKPYALTPGELASAVLLTSGAMTAALDRLEGAELVTRHADPDDRRVRSARLTRRGVRLAERAASKRFACAEEALPGLSRAERDQLVALLRKI